MTSLVRLGQSSLHRSIHSFRVVLRCTSTIAKRRFIPSQLYIAEDIEEYRPGGYHPIAIGDLFARGRYRIIHKLGIGASSTIWLARDRKKESGGLVTVKAMRADDSSKPLNEIPELVVSRSLQVAFPNSGGDFRTVEDHFIVRGPNGSHLFLIFPLLGPSVLTILNSTRRFQGDIARKVAKEMAKAVYRMHSADLALDNILFRVPETLRRWSDAEVYGNMGLPVMEEVKTCGREPRSIHAPLDLIAPIDASKFLHESRLQEAVTMIDYDQSYAIASPPRDYKPDTRLNYMSPELAFEGRISLETDVWALGCAIFEIRAGRPLFDPFPNSGVCVLIETVQTLGRLPDPWWSSFEDLLEDRTPQFKEDHGEPKSIEAQERAGHILQASKSSIGDELRSIGSWDDPPYSDKGPMMEKSGVRLDKEEVELLGDLLRKMLRYRPEEIIGMREVVEHPWFEL